MTEDACCDPGDCKTGRLRLGAVLLAAGEGVRLGGRAKGAIEIAGEPLLVRGLRILSEVGVDEVVTEIPSGRAKPPKLVPHRWHNLQLPLYALGLAAQSVEVDEIGYFSLGASRDAVQVSLWPGFSEELRDSALACAQWVIARIKEPHLLPRSEKVKYEAFEELKTGKVFELLDL